MLYLKNTVCIKKAKSIYLKAYIKYKLKQWSSTFGALRKADTVVQSIPTWTPIPKIVIQLRMG